ncbi:MAG: hypothetical protein U0S36_02375 [Candidatus Nanopelagicales bacterium]
MAQEVAQPLDRLRVEAVGRLVEEQHLRLGEDRAGEAEALAHAEGEAGGPLAGHAVEPDETDHLVDARRRHLRLRRQQAQVVARAARRVEELRVEVGADGAGDVLPVGERAAVPQRRAVAAVEAEHEPHGRRLAGAVGPEEARHESGLQRERELVDGARRAVGLAEPQGLDGHAHLQVGEPRP